MSDFDGSDGLELYPKSAQSDLRTRIAAAIAAQHVSEYQGGIHPEDVMRLADAVIRELDNMGIIHLSKVRYVTDWVPEGGQESGDDGQA